jgi:N-acyl-D-amino-acid deacylase
VNWQTPSLELRLWQSGPAVRLGMLITLSMGASAISADEISQVRLDDAIQRGLSVIQKAADNYPSRRKCFSCHHQALPLLGMQQARNVGMDIDEKIFARTASFTFDSFHSRISKLQSGRGIGGRANTVSYGLWTLGLSEHDADETTSAMVQFLLKTQRDDGSWRPPSNRPPLEESVVSVTVLSAYYMSQFTNDEQEADVEKAGA